MKEKIKPINTEKIRTYTLKNRKSKVSHQDFGRIASPGNSFSDFLDSLPKILAANDLRAIAKKVATAASSKKQVIIAMGAHVIKVGLSPILISLMEKGIITGLAMNGACIIHDTETALVGHTSEDVGTVLGSGEFGMAKETSAFFNEAVALGCNAGLGLGESIGRHILDSKLPYSHISLLGSAVRLSIPATVHVALGTDIVHMHPQADGAAIGQTSLYDFRLFCTLISMLEHGVYFNIGSAVILPEVFLKALSLVRNLGHEVRNFTAVNMDFVRHYRPMTNVVARPTSEGGQGYNMIGHHEIMLPLLTAAIIEELQ